MERAVCRLSRAGSGPGAARPDRRGARNGVRATGHAAALAALGLVAVTGCWSRRPAEPGDAQRAPPTMRMLAVLPIEPSFPPSGDSASSPLPQTEAGMVVTAQIYRVLADQTEFRFVPDLAVSDALETPAVRHAGSLLERALALGREVGADGVIFGRVFRYQKRVGTAFGATQPASVWFELGLVAVSSGDVVWRGSFNQTQEPLTSNLLKWWMFWRAGPRWITTSELTGLGVDRLFGDLCRSVNTEG